MIQAELSQWTFYSDLIYFDAEPVSLVKSKIGIVLMEVQFE